VALQCRVNRHVALICDNAPTHAVPDAEAEYEHGLQVFNMSHIEVIFLPPNVTSKVQPLDQGVVASFKAHYCRQLVQWMLEEANKDENEGKTLKSLTSFFYQMMLWTQKAWTQMVTAETIKNCWGKSGLLKSRNNEPAGASSGSEVGEAQVHMVDPDESQDSAIGDSAQYLSRLKAVTNHNGMLATNDELMDAHDFVILVKKRRLKAFQTRKSLIWWHQQLQSRHCRTPMKKRMVTSYLAQYLRHMLLLVRVHLKSLHCIILS
jgi:hypothetical protein